MFEPHRLLCQKSDTSLFKEARLIFVELEEGQEERGGIVNIVVESGDSLRSPQIIIGELISMLCKLNVEDEASFEVGVQEIFSHAHQVYAFCYSLIEKFEKSGDGKKVEQLKRLLQDLDNFLCIETVDDAKRSYMRDAYKSADQLGALISSGEFDESNLKHVGLVDNVRGAYSDIFARALMSRVNLSVGPEKGFLTGKRLYESLHSELKTSMTEEGTTSASGILVRRVLETSSSVVAINGSQDQLLDWQLLGSELIDGEELDPEYGAEALRLYRYFERHGALRPTLDKFDGHMVHRFARSLTDDPSVLFDNGGDVARTIRTLANRVRAMEGKVKSLLLDPLTRLPKPEVWMKKMEELQDRRNQPYTLVSVDFVGFKRFNDVAVWNGKMGHEVGDQALALAGRAFKSVRLRKGDLVARKGGEEFAIYLEGDVPQEEIFRILKEFDEALQKVNERSEFVYAEGHPLAGQKIEIAASFGVERFDPNLHGDVPGEVWAEADKAMYLNKFLPNKTSRDFDDRRAIAFGPSYGGGRYNFNGEPILEKKQLQTIRKRVTGRVKGSLRSIIGSEGYENGRVMTTARTVRGWLKRNLG